jgi:rod shape-determining protein MreD
MTFKYSIQAALSLLAAFIIHTFFWEISLPLFWLINVSSIVVLYYAIQRGEIFGAVLGMVAGLILDSFALGVFGVFGIAKTLLGYFAGTLSKKFDFVTFPRKIIFYICLLSFELIVWSGFSRLIFLNGVDTGGGLLFLQPIFTAFAAEGVFHAVKILNLYRAGASE